MSYRSIVEAVAHHANHTPDKVCLIESASGKECTYSSLWKHILSFSKQLKQAGLKSGENVVVRTEQTIDFIIAGLAVHLTGGVFVPIERNISEQRVIEMLDYMDSRFLIAAKPVTRECVYIDINTIYSDKLVIARENDENTVFPVPQALCDILFTTGTTGKSKGVMLTHEAQVAVCINVMEAMEYSSSDVQAVAHPLNHAGGLRRVYPILLVGGTCVVENGVIFIDKFFQSIQKYRVTSMNLVPAYVSLLLLNAPDKLKKTDWLRVVSVGGALLPVQYQDQLRAVLPNTRLFVAYGATEAGALSSFEFSKYHKKPFCIGKPYSSTSIDFLDDSHNPVLSTTKNNPAIIAVTSPTVMSGYWKESELTNSVLTGKQLLMADIGYRGDDDLIYVLGRRDDVIITGGHKVSPAEIEEIVIQIEGVKECACVAVQDDIMGSIPKLYVVMHKGVEFSQRVIFNLLTKRLEAYKHPRIIEEIDVLPRTQGTAKINRNALRG